MKTNAFSLFVILLVGCGSQDTSSTVETPSKPENIGSPPAADVKVPSLPAKSAEELAAAYKAAFERGDKAAIAKMVHWEGIPADHRDWTLRAVFNIRYADGVNGKIPTIELRDLPEGRFESDAYSLPPQKMLWGNYTGDGGGGDRRIPIGEVDGSFYFCARKPVPTKR